MSRLAFFLFLAVFVARLAAQSPSPSPSAPPAAVVPSPTPKPSEEVLVNTMGPADLQQALQLLKSNYVNPEALSELELNRAMLLGIMERLSPGAMIVSEKTPPPDETSDPFFGEILQGHIGYLRLGALTPANLQALDAFLQTMRQKKADAAVLDLRATATPNEFTLAAEVARRFVRKGKPLFALRKTAARPERAFHDERDPAFEGLMIVLADSTSAGPAEAIAGVLRLYNKALLIGQPTAGQAVEYSDLPLNGGRFLRVAVAEAVLPEGKPLFPGGLRPDLPVDMPPADKKIVFAQSREKGGMGPFIFENERPHLNEAALLAGRNPEIEAMEAAQRRRNEKPMTRDPVLQRAVDVVTSLAIYQER